MNGINQQALTALLTDLNSTMEILIGVPEHRTLAAAVGIARTLLLRNREVLDREIDWGEVDGELMMIVAKYAGGASRGLQDELRTLLRKVSGQ